MRVAQFIDTFSNGGAEKLALEFCTAIAERGHEPLLLHFGNHHLESRCREHSIPHQVIGDHPLYKSMRTLPRFTWRFARFLHRQRVDVIHSHLVGATVAAAPAARLTGIRHIGTLHDTYTLVEHPRYARLLQLAALGGTRLVAVSRQVEAALRQRVRIGRRLVTIRNGTRLSVAADSDRVRRELGVDPGEVVITCVARLVPLKAHGLLLRAFSELRPLPRTRLLLAGEGPLRAELQAWAVALGVVDRVHFLGNRGDIPDLLAASDLFVLASETEGLSCSLLEAMAAGLPVVATAVGGNPDLVEEGVSGRLVPVGDGAKLADALKQLVDHPDLRAAYGDRAARKAIDEFSFDAMVGRYFTLYGIPAS
ncbi:glycosyltransferase [Thiohalomonas denitrificans]|uniref:Glycosyltransferase involved in cell wall bisynthesis n=1 Tax=Thiohalomonas denitrificans TaxID=415747 RepID=A0A1G5QXD6_9GAMM|nr:glycosyltransferase [Thiohalomonas denitrificans]SCZ65911.1 Glycosyltransferase involved in cell wall bisynthesis [Thiohalomonas denitrificans]